MVTAGKEGVEPVSVSDYGAYVTCAGVHRTDREDCGITRSRADGLDGYAVLGGKRLRVCVDRPTLLPRVYLDGEPLNWLEVCRIPYDPDYRPDHWDQMPPVNRFYLDPDGMPCAYGQWADRHAPYRFTLDGYEVTLGVGSHYSHAWSHTVRARLVEPDGLAWEGECGLMFGSGHTDEPKFVIRVDKPGDHPLRLHWHKPVNCVKCHVRPVLRLDGRHDLIRCPECGFAVHNPDGANLLATPANRIGSARWLIRDWNWMNANQTVTQRDGWETGSYVSGVFDDGTWRLMSVIQTHKNRA